MVSRFFFIIFLGLFSIPLWAKSELNSIYRNNSGVRHLEKKEISSAEESFLNSMVEDPFNPVLHMNLGWTFELDGQQDKKQNEESEESNPKFNKALREYESALRIPGLSEELQFAAHFNAGNAAAQNSDRELALRHYQAALDIHPDSQEVRTNIELLFKGGQGKGKGKGGQGKGKNNNDDKNGQGQNPRDNPNQSPDENKKQEKPQFKSENLTKEDVRKILEELKSQEAKIRALEYGSKGKESNPDKDW